MVSLLAALVALAAFPAVHDLAVRAPGEDTLAPYSGTCPRCLHLRGWAKAQCPECGRRIRREPWLGVATALAAALVAATLGWSWVLPAYLLFVLLTTALLLTDLDHMRIVDRLNLPGTVMALALLIAGAFLDGDGRRLVVAGQGAGAYALGALILFLIARGGFGFGDVKLAVSIGAFTGYLGWGVLGRAVVTTAILGGLASLALLALGRASARTELPYGPFMIVGGWVAIILAGGLGGTILT